MTLSSNLAITSLPVESLKPYPNNARRHPKKQVRDLAESIEAFGFLVPIGIDENNVILSGHGRWEAAKILGLESVPCVRHIGLTDTQKRAYVLADNKIPEGATWDKVRLRLELNEIIVPDVQVLSYPTGFTIPEIEAFLQNTEPRPKPSQQTPSQQISSQQISSQKRQQKTSQNVHNPDDLPAQIAVPTRCQKGDLWEIGPHRLLCDEFTKGVNVKKLMGDDKASMALFEFTLGDADPESSNDTRITYATDLLKNVAGASVPGSFHFVVSGWTEIDVFQAAGRGSGAALRDLIVWDTQITCEAEGLYTSAHRLILAFQSNPPETGLSSAVTSHFRQRSNLWSYREIETAHIECNGLEMAVDGKPLAMLTDVISEASREGEIILDAMGWSGSILVAAHRTGRKAYLCEYDLTYCDLILARAEMLLGQKPALVKRDPQHASFEKGVEA